MKKILRTWPQNRCWIAICWVVVEQQHPCCLVRPAAGLSSWRSTTTHVLLWLLYSRWRLILCRLCSKQRHARTTAPRTKLNRYWLCCTQIHGKNSSNPDRPQFTTHHQQRSRRTTQHHHGGAPVVHRCRRRHAARHAFKRQLWSPKADVWRLQCKK